MKKNVMTVFACVVIFFAAFFLTGLIFGNGGEVSAVDKLASADKLYGDNYCIKEHNGYVAVFYGDYLTSPAIETDIQIQTLRESDRERLREGIIISSYEEVLRLIEDFGP